jgi:hypothetical protein
MADVVRFCRLCGTSLWKGDHNDHDSLSLSDPFDSSQSGKERSLTQLGFRHIMSKPIYLTKSRYAAGLAMSAPTVAQRS